jgi:hypothetical protein
LDARERRSCTSYSGATAAAVQDATGMKAKAAAAAAAAGAAAAVAQVAPAAGNGLAVSSFQTQTSD